MSLESALKTLSIPSAPQPQATSPSEVMAATSEAEAKSKAEAQPSANDLTKTEGVVEAKPTSTETPKKEEAISSKFSALAKKEKAIVKRDQEIKAKETAYSEREAKLAEREAKIKQSEELWDTDVFKALELRGYDYTKLTNLMLEGKTAAPGETDPVKLAKKTIEDFKAEQKKLQEETAATTKKAQEALELKQKEELEAAWENYNNEVNEFVTSNPDTYELINLYGQQALIAQTVDEFYKENKRVLSVKEAADLVESYLESEAKKALSSKKFGSETKGKESAPKKSESEEQPKITKTLNNSMQPTAASVLPAQSESDRMRRAMAALERNK